MLRMLMGAVLLAATLAIVPTSASAETFKIGDLGETPSRRICMSVAQQVLNAYLDKYGGHSAVGNSDETDSWSFYGWDLQPGNNDVVITCPIVADQANAFYTIHSSGDDSEANSVTTADRLRELWKDLF